jgi:hypothetical protein
MVQEVGQAEIVAKQGLGEVNAQDALRASPERQHRTIGWWPSGSTVLRVLLIGFLVIVAIGWALTLLN